jgi:hypothetical protein
MAERIELVASATQTASGNSAAFSVPTAVMAMLGIDITAGSTVTKLDIYLEGSDDGGTTWYELPCDVVMKTSAVDADNAATSAPQRDVVKDKASTAAEKFTGIYRQLPADYVRLRWIFTGTSFTMSASLVVK